jgi:hypothetical protein
MVQGEVKSNDKCRNKQIASMTSDEATQEEYPHVIIKRISFLQGCKKKGLESELVDYANIPMITRWK